MGWGWLTARALRARLAVHTRSAGVHALNTQPIPRAAAAPLLALALAAAGCPSDDGTCESSALCEAGTFCFEGECVEALPAAASCTPPTEVPTFATGSVASDPQPSCPPVPVPPSLPAGWVLRLSVNGTPDADYPAFPSVDASTGQTVSFTLPAGTSSLTIHHQGVSAAADFDFYPYTNIPNMVAPSSVRAPDGGTVYSDDVTSSPVIDPSFQSVSYLAWAPWGSSLTVPQTSRLYDLALAGGELPAGDWSFRVNDWNAQCAEHAAEGCWPGSPAQGTYDVTVVARPGPYVSTGTLDVGVYLASQSAPAASVAANDAGYRRFVWALGQVLGRAGLCLGTVTFFDLPAWAPSMPSYTESPPCSDLATLFSLASPTVDGVHLFLVDGFAEGGGILGIDGSIPGPSGLPGSINSGAAMVSGDIGAGNCTALEPDVANCGSDLAGYIAAHEIGHWLGLYHTTEWYGGQFDPLGDTPSCACDACAPSTERSWCGDEYYAPQMSPYWCLSSGETCGGGDNLMFWAYDEGASRGKVTAEQGLVMRVNPAVK